MKKSGWISAAVLLAAGCLGAFYVPGGTVGQLAVMGLGEGQGAPRRLVSLAPSLTETLFAIGAGPNVKGVTSFCHFPPEADRLPKVGGFYDPNYEAILSLRPDLVVLLPESSDARLRLQRLNLPSLTLEQHSLAGVTSSFLILGNLCHCEAQGAWWARRFRDGFAHARVLTQGKPRLKTLLVLGRDYNQAQIRSVYAIGRGEIYDEVLTLAGGKNAYTASQPKYPQLSVEGMLALDPDVILELVPDAEASKLSPGSLQKQWESLSDLRAVRTGRVKVLTGDFLTVPGPRLMQTLQAFGKALHPDLDWNW